MSVLPIPPLPDQHQHHHIPPSYVPVCSQDQPFGGPRLKFQTRTVTFDIVNNENILSSTSRSSACRKEFSLATSIGTQLISQRIRISQWNFSINVKNHCHRFCFLTLTLSSISTSDSLDSSPIFSSARGCDCAPSTIRTSRDYATMRQLYHQCHLEPCMNLPTSRLRHMCAENFTNTIVIDPRSLRRILLY